MAKYLASNRDILKIIKFARDQLSIIESCVKLEETENYWLDDHYYCERFVVKLLIDEGITLTKED